MGHENLFTVVTWIYLLSCFTEILNTLLLGRLMGKRIAGATAWHPFIMLDQNMFLQLSLVMEGCLALAASQGVLAMSQNMFLQIVAL